jgi:hypothetical protein
MKYVVLAVIAGFIGGSAVTYSFFPEVKTPCIYNFKDSWLWYMEQVELNDIDDTAEEKQFHDMIVKVLKDQNGLYVTKHGIEYVVPKNCYVEDN